MKLITLVLSVLAVVFPSTGQAFWIDNPNVAKKPEGKIWIAQRNIKHAKYSIWFAKHNTRLFTYKKWVGVIRYHQKVISTSQKHIVRWHFLTTPPHQRQWLCIHHFEGSWQDGNDPYWGGLQMDRQFMRSYAPAFLLHRGWADKWTPREQMWVAERAHDSGRGFSPWPNTARYCGLL